MLSRTQMTKILNLIGAKYIIEYKVCRINYSKDGITYNVNARNLRDAFRRFIEII